jgi:two-component system sensor histidine kinase VicK
MRLITDFTKDNLLHCKQIMEYFHEVRHLDGVKGNFLVTDTAYDATAQAEESQPPLYLIFSNVKVFVEQQQYVFDTLWNKGIPAKQRIREIEKGLKREFIETVQDPVEIINLIPKVISSATEEISVLFSSLNSMKRYYAQGILIQIYVVSILFTKRSIRSSFEI